MDAVSEMATQVMPNVHKLEKGTYAALDARFEALPLPLLHMALSTL